MHTTQEQAAVWDKKMLWEFLGRGIPEPLRISRMAQEGEKLLHRASED